MQLQGIFSIRFILGGLIFIGFIVFYWQSLSFERFVDTPINWPDKNQALVVEKGNGLNKLASQWYQQDVITSEFYLKLFAYLNPEFKQVKVGEYQIENGETPRTLLTKLKEGKVIQYAFTIVEGTNKWQLIDLLKEEPNLIFDLAEDSAEQIKQLNLDWSNIEGWFYPDTYYFSKGTSALELLKRANQKMREVLEQEWQNRAVGLPYKNPYEALIMASIVEKETGIPSERDMIAGVFIRRLEKRMRLQTDPTIIYGIGPDFNGDITFKDLRTPTPYNTYVIKGLPPTPIAMPGRAAIHAALNPADGSALYFVATGNGGHYFSDTLEEHNRAVRKYQLRK
ncbi:endolytic transglycosylase MltG [Aliikangiella marina]|uniref:Endolytic murein transglycosylase n=1 Tax=Aliikangiella marina TaxID=1712262 RepID=A0A545TJN1_9GAMM|nr:endolytic transglycosylase MltG [Aliikangiella marina]TQV77433.1 endolytic transglycosylase MltG [Aliikangiella marina]